MDLPLDAVVVYVLIDPRDSCTIGYVGITTNYLPYRLGAHWSERQEPSDKGAWLRTLPSMPLIEEVAVVRGYPNAITVEEVIRLQLIAQGHPISNA